MTRAPMEEGTVSISFTVYSEDLEQNLAHRRRSINTEGIIKYLKIFTLN